jgi:hypothetical protein
MPLVEDRSRPSSMAVASRCTTAPIAAVPAIGGTGRSGRRSATSASISLATRTAPAYAVAIGTDAAERRFGNNPGGSLDEN